MKKVASRPPPSSFTADPFAEDAADSSLGSSLIHRPEAVGSAGLAQNSNFFQKLQLAQNSLRTSQDVDDGLRSPEAMVSTLDDSRPAERFSPLISAAAKTRTGGGGGAVFPQELDIITASGGGGGDGGSAQSSGGFFEDFDFEEAPPAENLFRVSSQLRVGGREEEKEDELRFPGTVLEDATTRKIGKPNNGSGALTSCTYVSYQITAPPTLNNQPMLLYIR
jgi:hypothetical protein